MEDLLCGGLQIKRPFLEALMITLTVHLGPLCGHLFWKRACPLIHLLQLSFHPTAFILPPSSFYSTTLEVRPLTFLLVSRSSRMQMPFAAEPLTSEVRKDTKYTARPSRWAHVLDHPWVDPRSRSTLGFPNPR